jgi:hypothetical protein
LLARREQVRSTKTAAAVPKPELFRPEKPFEGEMPTPEGAKSPEQAPTPPADSEAKDAAPASTASRLLEAKRRAQKRRGNRPD